jgi:hypothetical protein
MSLMQSSYVVRPKFAERTVADRRTCEIVDEWLQTNAERLGLKELRREHSDKIAKFGADYELRGYLISIGAWDNGRCLDIDVLNTKTKLIQMSQAGPCADENQILLRLSEFAEWVERESNQR